MPGDHWPYHSQSEVENQQTNPQDRFQS